MNTTAESLGYLRVRKIGDCTRCPLHLNRTKIVFGEGDPDADIMFVGEAPGAREDQTGRPFIGAAGKCLESWLGAVGLKRSGVYITNTVLCRPLGNRDPYPQEKDTCAPYLHTQIFLVRPKVLVALGRHAANTLTGQKLSMAELRKERHSYENAQTGLSIPVVALYHPSYVLRRGRGEAEEMALSDLRDAIALAGPQQTPQDV